MQEILDKFDNFLLALCTLSDNSFLRLFGAYCCFMLAYTFLAFNIETYVGMQTKVYWYDLVFLFLLFCMFARNSYYLHKVKIKSGITSFEII